MFFSSLRLSSQKKENFSFTPVRRKSQSLSFASRASEYYTHIKDHHHGKFCDDDDRKDDDASCCSLYSFRFCCVHLSLSLSLFFLA